MEQCIKAHPHLHTLAGDPQPNLRETSKMTAIRDHAVELAKNSLIEDLRELAKEPLDPNSVERKHAKD